MSSIKMANGALVAYYELEYFFDRQHEENQVFLNYNEGFFFFFRGSKRKFSNQGWHKKEKIQMKPTNVFL